MSHPKLPNTYTNTGFSDGSDSDDNIKERKCILYTLEATLEVKYSKVVYPDIPQGTNPWETRYNGDVCLELEYTKEELEDYDCDKAGHVDYPKKCPERCKYEQEEHFSGTKCGKKAKNLGDFVSKAPGNSCDPSKVETCGKGKEVQCRATQTITCTKEWINCDGESKGEGLDWYFEDSGKKSICLNGAGTGGDWTPHNDPQDKVGNNRKNAKARAQVAWKILERIAAIQKAGGAGAVNLECKLCGYVCCLMKGMLPGGGGPSCHNGGSGGPGSGSNLGTSKHFGFDSCGGKWAKFLLVGGCQQNSPDLDEDPEMLKNWSRGKPCFGCCKKPKE